MHCRLHDSQAICLQNSIRISIFQPCSTSSQRKESSPDLVTGSLQTICGRPLLQICESISLFIGLCTICYHDTSQDQIRRRDQENGRYRVHVSFSRTFEASRFKPTNLSTRRVASAGKTEERCARRTARAPPYYSLTRFIRSLASLVSSFLKALLGLSSLTSPGDSNSRPALWDILPTTARV